MAGYVEKVIEPISMPPSLYVTGIADYEDPTAADYTGEAGQYEVEIRVPEPLAKDSVVKFLVKGLIKAKGGLETTHLLAYRVFRGPKVPRRWALDQRMYKIVWWSHGSPLLITATVVAGIAKVFTGLAVAFVAAAIFIVVARGKKSEWPQALSAMSADVKSGVKWWSIALLVGATVGVLTTLKPKPGG